jgi:hypothetical protein
MKAARRFAFRFTVDMTRCMLSPGAIPKTLDSLLMVAPNPAADRSINNLIGLPLLLVS